uniref:Ig-like domain-containing protein n=1 Tax=Poecilia formosa TaxID=48698 RepID=A0A087XY39_POEFO
AVFGTDVSCVLNENCIIPCRFRNRMTNIEWKLFKLSVVIVSHDHRGSRYSESFRSRASLFEDQISRGNFSLLLRGMKVDDEGTYWCIGKIKGTEYFKHIEIHAPVSSVRIHQDGNRITCSSEGIYPEPELTWSTEPPSNTTLQSRTTVHQTEEKLYDISSSLTVPDGPDRIYSCSIRTKRIWWGATLTRAAESRTKVSCFLNESCILPCRFRNRVTDMTWEREIPKSQIVTYNQSGSRYSESFRSRASLSEDQISRGNGKLLLRGVKVDDEGTYWCKVFTTGIYYRHSV